MPRNELYLDYANNPDLAAFFATKQPGDKCKLEVTLQIKDKNDKTLTGAIEKVAYEEAPQETEPADKEAADETEPSADEPTMIRMMSSQKPTESNAYVPG